MAKDNKQQQTPEVEVATPPPQAAAAPAPTSAPAVATAPAAAPAAGTQKYRVSLKGVRSRLVDDEGRPYYSEFLDVDAVTPGDAIQKFNKYNGIIASEHPHQVALAPATEAAA